jgi:hypothetical protein
MANTINSIVLPSEGIDKRHSVRRRMLKQARVLLSDTTSVTCLVRDLSNSGARLVFGGPTTIPQSFCIEFIWSDRLLSANLACNRGLAAGISFKS